MKTFTFSVTVEAETKEEAIQVMQERILYEEDYGFDYEIFYSDRTLEESKEAHPSNYKKNT